VIVVQQIAHLRVREEVNILEIPEEARLDQVNIDAPSNATLVPVTADLLVPAKEDPGVLAATNKIQDALPAIM
jgi:hypothetical protein